METTKILFISGSLGLGHIVRDLVIARELRERIPDLEISWLASHPAKRLLRDAEEMLLPEADLLADENTSAESAAKDGFRLNLFRSLTKMIRDWIRNIDVYRQVFERDSFDVVVADEAYEMWGALAARRIHLESPFVMIFDFLGVLPMTWNPFEKLSSYLMNRRWVKAMKIFDDDKNKSLFVGEPGDVADRRFGPFLPNCRDLATKTCEFVGYILPFDPEAYRDKAKVRARLGYGEEPLVICSIGGTSVGRGLLELCGHAYPIAREAVPDLRMVMVCGPRVAPESLAVPEGVDVKAYIPSLFKHFAACDLAIVQGGGTTTLELTALRRPFLYFPLEEHYEQQVHVAGRLARHGAGVKMSYSQQTAESLAEKIVSFLDQDVTCSRIDTKGAQRVARIVGELV